MFFLSVHIHKERIKTKLNKSITYRVLTNSLAFILGFSVIFIFVIGSLAGALTDFINQYQDVISKILGVAVLILGIHMLGIFKIKSLMKEERFQMGSKRRWGLIGSFLVGMAFAFGWTPCVGPILATIFALAGESGSYGQALLTMTVYSLGLAIPFFIAALAVNLFLNWFNKFKRYFRVVEIVSGILVMGVGVLIFLGVHTSLNQYYQGLGGIESSWEDKVLGGKEGVTLLIAFIGGLISFLSPCVLPLVPAYISYLSGASIAELRGESKPKAQ